ncbi:hypothetical protein EGW08_002271 [Elysia chlorotica]|uniref:PARP n=1 Tax=Elysia chlorotica TaxID=188477 RepID=A0A433U860_ELYCH|nr:hypothetical protein EGW08_002271 [Elysia chlorotica]
MAGQENCIKVTDLPEDITEDDIRIIFQNRRRQGGGPIQKITLDTIGTKRCALIYFKEPEAVDIILARGDTVTIDDYSVPVSRHKGDKRQSKTAHSKNTASDKFVSATSERLQREVKKAKINKPSEQIREKSTPSNFDFEEDGQFELVVKSTIKATVRDVCKSKVFYILYLEDPKVSKDKFDESSLLLDCLNKVLYVTFDDEDGAIRACQQKHGRDSNFVKVEMASKEDFDTYPNKVLVHGFDLKDQSKRKTFLDFVYRQTRLKVQDIIQWREPWSAILVFDEDECENIVEICWKLRTEFQGIKILTAPVFKTKTVSVSGLPPKFDKCLLQRYLSNRRSGGGPVDSLNMQNNVAIVTFKEEEHFFGVLEKKNHCLESYELKIEPYYDCLSTSAFKRSPSSKTLARDSTPEEKMEDATSFKENEPEEQSEDDDAEYIGDEEFSLAFERKDIILLQRTDILKQFRRKYPTVKMTVKAEDSSVNGRGDSSLHKVMAELLQMSIHKFKSEKLSQLSKPQLELLKEESLQDEINKKFQEDKKQVVLVVEDNTPVIYYIAPTSIENLISIVNKFIYEETRKLPDPNSKLLLLSKQGQEFLGSLSKASDGSPLPVLIKYNEHDNSLLTVAPQLMRAELHHRIDEFLKENVMDVKNITLSEGKVQFINRYKKTVMGSLKEDAKNVGVMVKESQTSFEVRGKRDEVATLVKRLISIRDAIFIEEFSLKFFGIKEYMSEREGKSIKEDIEKKFSCCIFLNSDGDSRKSLSRQGPPVAMKPIAEPQTVATADLLGYTLHFMQGDLLGLKAKAIANPIDETKQLKNIGNLSRNILSQGGAQIQTDLLKAVDSELVTVTGSGNLQTCQHILHVVLQNFNFGGGNSVKTAVAAVLDCASRRRISSVGFPCLGSGKSFGYPNLTVCMQTMSAIKEHIESGIVSPVDIYLCDKSDEMLSSLIDRCEQTFPEFHINRLIELKSKPQPGPTPKPRRYLNPGSTQQKDFGHLRIKLHQGEITKWKIQTIVISVDKSLDLRKGTLAKLVSRHGGDTVQQELKDNYSDGIQTGKFAQSSGGNLKCEHIFYACIGHWKGDNGPQAKQMQSLIEEILAGANSIPVTSIALPALGTGNLKYPSDVVANVFCDAISNFARSNPSSTLKNIDIVIYPQDTEVYHAFQAELAGDAARRSRKPKNFFDDDEDDEDIDNRDDSNDTSSGGAFGFIKSVGKMVSSFMKKDGNKISYGPVTLTITKGDITQEKSDAIVCSIKNSMDLSASGAVCKDLLKKCGASLQAECNNQQMAMQQTGVAMTSASGLPCQNIYFVSMEKFSTSWDRGVLQVLQEAANGGATSIALPLLGSGAKNPNMDKIKKKFLAGVEKYGQSQNISLKDVRLVIFSQEMFDFFVAKAARPGSASKQDENPPKETLKPKPKVSDKVDLKLYANDDSHADKIKQDLIQTYKSKLASHKMDEKRIKQLSSQQIHDLEHVAWENRVQITVRQEEGVVVLRSFFPFTKVITMLTSLMLEAVESHHKALHQATTTAIVWQYQDKGDKWTNFEPL